MNKFLGPYGKATIILMTAQFDSELPTIGAIKKALKISDGKYYRSSGLWSSEINELEGLLKIIKNGGSEDVTYLRNKASTHFFVTFAGVNSDIFAMLKYSAQIVAGFDLTEENFKELKDIKNDRYTITRLISGPARWLDELEFNIKTAKEIGVSDETIINVDIAGIERIMKNYGIPAIEVFNKKLGDWYEQHRWKTSFEAKNWATSEVQSDQADQSAALL